MPRRLHAVIKPHTNVFGQASYKFMIAVGDKNYEILEAIAEERQCSIQELLRGIVIPEWFKQKDLKNSQNGKQP